MKDKKHIFFDLDHTLWDFEKNARETLATLHEKHEIQKRFGKGKDLFIESYERINYELWELYNSGLMTKELLRTERFHRVFVEMGVEADQVPKKLWEEYLEMCPLKTNLIEGAEEICQYLSAKYEMHLITNGFQKTQETKVNTSGLARFFRSMTTSESLGISKPNKEIFIEALRKASCTVDESIMIGDNLKTDIGGAKGIGMTAIWYNPEGKNTTIETNQVAKLLELKNLL